MKKLLILIALMVSVTMAFAQPVNDACSNAINLVTDAGLTCGTTENATIQGGECYTNYGGGVSETSVWYSFTATNDSIIFSFNKTNITNTISPRVRIFAAGATCLPVCGSAVYDELYNGDPGQHTMVTGATVGATYLIHIQGNESGGSNDRHTEFCLGIFNTKTNNTINGPSMIDECGIVFNGTNIGYTAEDLTPGEDNLDSNNATTCPTCVTAGDDVPYVVNNSSWFSFCAATAGTYNINFTGITNCTNNTLNDGLQMSIFRGTPTNITLIQHAPSPSQPGSNWTSTTFAVSAGECVFLVVDGFAGDQCDYQYTLNNITGGCNVALPVELLGMYTQCDRITWFTLTEINNDYFTLYHSYNAHDWEEIGTKQGSGNTSTPSMYEIKSEQFPSGYYKLTQTDFNGTTVEFPMKYLKCKEDSEEILESVWSIDGRFLGNTYPVKTGMYILKYKDKMPIKRGIIQR